MGFFDPDGNFQTDSDHDVRDDAAKRVAWLNGSLALTLVTAVEARVRRLEDVGDVQDRVHRMEDIDDRIRRLEGDVSRLEGGAS